MDSFLAKLRTSLLATTITPLTPPELSIFTVSKSTLSPTPPTALLTAKAALHRTQDLFTSTPYHQISLAQRQLHEFTSLVYALRLSESDEWLATLNILDRTILTSGAPSMTAQVMQWIELMQALLPPLEPPPATGFTIDCALPEVQNAIQEYDSPPPLHVFERDHLLADKPCVIRGALVGDWPAVEAGGEAEWTVDRLREVLGRRLVPVEVGAKYTDDEGWGQKIVTGREFVDRYLLGVGGEEGGFERDVDSSEPESNDAESNHGGDLESTRKLDGTSESSKRVKLEPHREIGYLAQHDLFAQVPSLYNEIRVPEYCYLSYPSQTLHDVKISAWFGPGNTVSPLHTDPHMNIFAQAMGRKYLRLHAPCETPNVYPHEGGMLTNTSQVDIEHVDHNQFPRYRDSVFEDVVLEPGDLLFMPKGWWHFVKSGGPSFSVSFWF
ncbi:hypothetical protein HDU98_000660 [Podochytrium sp. JEL0797]|nr:hypothetical protein HDU98_000660 [Podochytrium sp. JEL0797]